MIAELPLHMASPTIIVLLHMASLTDIARATYHMERAQHRLTVAQIHNLPSHDVFQEQPLSIQATSISLVDITTCNPTCWKSRLAASLGGSAQLISCNSSLDLNMHMTITQTGRCLQGAHSAELKDYMFTSLQFQY